MKSWEELEAVERQPGKVSGIWLFRGTRIPVSALFENLRDGATVDDFLEWFPGVEHSQIDALLQVIERDQIDLSRIEADLSLFERDYEMASADFWLLYQAGQMADTFDNFEWNVLCKAQERIEKRIAILRGSL